MDLDLLIPPLDFKLPPALEAHEPPEARGLARDQVRLLVSHRATNRIEHARFNELAKFLAAGDLLVLNTSGTMNAALAVTRADGTPLELHLSTHLPGELWVVEVRQPAEVATKPFYEAHSGEALLLPDGAQATLHAPYHFDDAVSSQPSKRLWVATLRLPCALNEYLERNGFPIRYNYVPRAWQASYYQTVYATEVGSAEMPSAGRAFTPELITQLSARGILFAPLILHTGVASLESNEPPYEEYYRVSATTARAVNATRAAHHRVIAVGTTVVRALETVTDMHGIIHPGEGWTRLVITPDHRMRALDALLTGWHEAKATHLAMLEALAGRGHLQVAYREALKNGYLWHEFGDLHLILP